MQPLNALAISRFAKFTPLKSTLFTLVPLNTAVDNIVGFAASVVGTVTSALVPVYFVRSVAVSLVVYVQSRAASSITVTPFLPLIP